MPNTGDWNRLSGELSRMGLNKAARTAKDFASGPSAEERAADARADLRAKLDAVNGAIAAGQAQARKGRMLPKGFMPIRQLQQNGDAQENALRLKRSIHIDPATMEDPLLVFPGLWVVIMDNFGQGITKNLFGLKEDGNLEGRVLEFGGEAAHAINSVARFEAGRRTSSATSS